MAANQPPKDTEVPQAASDSTSSLTFVPIPNQNFLIAGSWDNSVRIWNIQQQQQQQQQLQQQQALGSMISVAPVHSYSHDAPVLCVAASKDGKIFSAGCDNTAKCYQLAAGGASQPIQVAKHDAPIKCAHFVDDANILMTGSWDCTIRYWDLRSSGPVSIVKLPERLYCSSVFGELAVIGTADRNLIVYDLRNPTVEFKRIASPLKLQTRCVACFIDKTGFAVGSIEGRVAIHYFNDSNPSKNFAFKCHRTEIPASISNPTPTTNVYAVNSMCFHPLYGTLATTGSDGTFHFWDKQERQRLRAFNVAGKPPIPIPCSAFSPDGTLFAYAVCYDWSQGAEGYSPNTGNRIMVHRNLEEELRPKKSN